MQDHCQSSGWEEGGSDGQFGFQYWFDPRDEEGWVNPKGRWQLEMHCCGIDHVLHLKWADAPGRRLSGFNLKGKILRGKPHFLPCTVQQRRNPVALGLPLGLQSGARQSSTDLPPDTPTMEHVSPH